MSSRSKEYRRLRWNPGERLIESIMDYQRARFVLLKKWAVLRHRFWSAVSGADIPINSAIGPGLYIPHPIGIVIHPRVKFGERCTLMARVTIGAGMREGLPVLGNDVYVGTGACILGGVTIGDGAMIGANAVVLHDIPAGATAIGVPAHTLPSKVREPADTAG